MVRDCNMTIPWSPLEDDEKLYDDDDNDKLYDDDDEDDILLDIRMKWNGMDCPIHPISIYR